MRGLDEKSLNREPDPEKVVEAAWLPLWQVHLLMPELLDREIPATFSEDHTSQLNFRSMVPMGRIFVMEPRLERARAVIEEIIGEEPRGQGER